MNKNSDLIIIRNFAKKHSDLDDIHGFPHVKRVYNLCLEIGEKLNADLKLLKIATLLHDIGRIYEFKDTQKRNHAEISAEKALGFLNSRIFNLSQEDIENIIHCVKAHSFSNKVIPKTLEAKILSDADKLDAIGAIGLYRTIGYTVKNKGGIEEVIKHLENKILKLRDLLFLEESKKLAGQRQKILIDFYKKIKNQVK
ncbi:MAG: HD domain-containing protein [Candidatus Hodarchaeota archaeon]